jgi:imidazolonepropionase-like amidohydrolase
VEAGLTPYQVLRAATGNAGEFLGAPIGTIAPGKRADLLLLHANPLINVRDVSALDAVVLGGRWLPQEKLQAMLNSLAAAH